MPGSALTPRGSAGQGTGRQSYAVNGRMTDNGFRVLLSVCLLMLGAVPEEYAGLGLNTKKRETDYCIPRDFSGGRVSYGKGRREAIRRCFELVKYFDADKRHGCKASNLVYLLTGIASPNKIEDLLNKSKEAWGLGKGYKRERRRARKTAGSRHALPPIIEELGRKYTVAEKMQFAEMLTGLAERNQVCMADCESKVAVELHGRRTEIAIPKGLNRNGKRVWEHALWVSFMHSTECSTLFERFGCCLEYVPVEGRVLCIPKNRAPPLEHISVKGDAAPACAQKEGVEAVGMSTSADCADAPNSPIAPSTEGQRGQANVAQSQCSSQRGAEEGCHEDTGSASTGIEVQQGTGTHTPDGQCPYYLDEFGGIQPPQTGAPDGSMMPASGSFTQGLYPSNCYVGIETVEGTYGDACPELPVCVPAQQQQPLIPGCTLVYAIPYYTMSAPQPLSMAQQSPQQQQQQQQDPYVMFPFYLV